MYGVVIDGWKAIEEAGIRGMCGILQAIARLTYNNGEIFQPEEYVYTGQTTRMDPKGK